MAAESNSPFSESVEAAAAVWLSLRDRGLTPEEAAAFVHWLQQDARHAEVFGELDRTWRTFDRLAAVPAAGTLPDAELLAPRIRPPRRPAWRWPVTGLAAAVVLVLLVVAPWRTSPQMTETVVGAFQKLDLPDGSVAQLNTDTAIETMYTSTGRHVRVLRGEVYFAVAKDPSRPFVVTAGPVSVRAVGTAFNVRHREQAIEVFVTEGQVSVGDARRARAVADAPSVDAEVPFLLAGDRTLVPVSRGVPAAPQVEKMTAMEMQRALAWQERRLEFESTPLAEIVIEFNRYNRRRLIVDDPQLATRRFSGTFRADGYESFVRLLETDFGVEVVNRGDALLLRAGR